MASNTIITLNSPSGRLEGFPDGAKVWARVSQICDTLGINRATFYRIVERDPSVVPEGHTALIPWPSDGGEQPTRVYSLDAVLNVAMEVNNKRARRLRRWLVAVLRGQAPVPRAPTDSLARLPDARAILAQPTVQAAIARLDALDAADAAHQNRPARERPEVTRRASMQGPTLDGRRPLRMRARVLAELPRLRVKPSVALDA